MECTGQFVFTQRLMDAWNVLQRLVVATGTIVMFKRLLHRQWICREWRYMVHVQAEASVWSHVAHRHCGLVGLYCSMLHENPLWLLLFPKITKISTKKVLKMLSISTPNNITVM